MASAGVGGMMEWLQLLVEAAAKRPEILGIVALGSLMAYMLREKKQRNGTAMFKAVIHAQLAGIYLLGAALIVRTAGWQAVKIWGCGP